MRFRSDPLFGRNNARAATAGQPGARLAVPPRYPGRLRGLAAPQKSLILLAPRAGFEPATNRLTADGLFVARLFIPVGLVT